MGISRKILAAAAVTAGLGLIGHEDYQNAKFAEAEYCARVVAGVHTDYDGLCPSGSFNTYSGLPGDVSCVGTGECGG